MDVVGGSVAEIFVGKAVPERARAWPEMRGHELAAGDRPAAAVGGHPVGEAGHESLRPHREQFESLLAVEPVRQPHRLAVAGQRGGQLRVCAPTPWFRASWLPKHDSQGICRPPAVNSRSAALEQAG